MGNFSNLRIDNILEPIKRFQYREKIRMYEETKNQMYEEIKIRIHEEIKFTMH